MSSIIGELFSEFQDIYQLIQELCIMCIRNEFIVEFIGEC